MKRLIMTAIAIAIAPALVFAGDDVTENPQDISVLTYMILSAAVPWVCGAIGSFIETKPTDSRWVKVLKKLLNLLGASLTQKAGK